MRQCPACGLMTDSSDLLCPVCGHRLPIRLGVSERTLRKLGLAILIPLLVYIAMTRLFG
jgi:hypothetical protein